MLKSFGLLLEEEAAGEGEEALEAVLAAGAGWSEIMSSTGLGGLGAASSRLLFSRVRMALLTLWVPWEAAMTEGSRERICLKSANEASSCSRASYAWACKENR